MGEWLGKIILGLETGEDELGVRGGEGPWRRDHVEGGRLNSRRLSGALSAKRRRKE